MRACFDLRSWRKKSYTRWSANYDLFANIKRLSSLPLGDVFDYLTFCVSHFFMSVKSETFVVVSKNKLYNTRTFVTLRSCFEMSCFFYISLYDVHVSCGNDGIFEVLIKYHENWFLLALRTKSTLRVHSVYFEFKLYEMVWPVWSES